ncbi:MAG: hypothetical protein JWM21_194 [Acidobacteria bacterium]|nr:hypothetical protein [Acidobacteriota bacterium]
MSAQAEQWRVSTIEGIFETDLDTLRQWIVEGCILPTDKVSKGKLNWIEAGRAPMLRAAFKGEAAVTSPAVTITEPPPMASHAETPMMDPPIEKAESDWATHAFDDEARPAPGFTAPTLTNACHNHPDISPEFVCRICATPFCADCPRFVGATKIPVCPLCGDMCKPYAEVRQRVERLDFQSSGFGFADFARALRYPLQHKIALLFGAAVYGFLQLAGVRGRVVAFVIMFGCISHVISQVAWGRLNRSFLPDFSAFSMWDDLAVPIGLGIGITIVTWGPMIAIGLALVFGVINGPSMSPFGAPPAANAPQPTAVTPADLAVLTDPEADPKKLEEANAKLNHLRPGSQIAEQAEKSKKELNDPTSDLTLLLKYFHLPIIVVLLLVLSIGWGIFYYPMALSVAGYTEHFGSVVNPLVGLDTIRHMGGTYFKAFGMVLLVQIVGFVVSVIVGTITAPLAMPFFGNLPANFIDGSFTFYFNLVIACVLGLSLHKCADRLGIE